MVIGARMKKNVKIYVLKCEDSQTMGSFPELCNENVKLAQNSTLLFLFQVMACKICYYKKKI